MYCRNCGEENPSGLTNCLNCGEVLESVLEDADFAINVGAAYGNGWHQLKRHFVQLLIISVIFAVISIPGTSLGSIAEESNTGMGSLAGLLSFLFNTLLTNPTGYGVSYAYLRAVRDEPVDTGHMFAAFQVYWTSVIASLVVTVIVIIGFFLLIAPGFYLMTKLVFTPYLVVDRRLKVAEAMQESWRMTRGHEGQVFLTILVAIPIFIGGIILFIVGAFFAMMWIMSAIAALYHAVCLDDEGKSAFDA